MKAGYRTIPLTEAFWFQEGPGVRNWQFHSDGVKLLNVGNILPEGTIDLSKTDRHLSEIEAYGKYAHFLADAGDLVMASSGISFDPDGYLRTKTAFVEESHLPLCMNTSTIRFKPANDGYSLRFLRHWLASVEFRKQVSKFVTGSAQLNFGPSHLKAMEITIPTLTEQQRIATVLDAADALRAKRRAAIAKLHTLAQSIFTEMFRTELSSPDRVPLAPLLEEFRYGTSTKSATHGYPTLRIPNVVGGAIDASELKFVPLDDPEFQRIKLRDGDVLFVRTNGNPDYVGRCAVFTHAQANAARHQSNDWAYASYLIRARVKLDRLNPWFLKAFLHHPEGRKALKDRSKTSAGQFNINTDSLGSIPIPLVPLEKQTIFEQASSRIAPIHLNYSRSQRELDVLFASLQHRAFRGELTETDEAEIAA